MASNRPQLRYRRVSRATAPVQLLPPHRRAHEHHVTDIQRVCVRCCGLLRCLAHTVGQRTVAGSPRLSGREKNAYNGLRLPAARTLAVDGQWYDRAAVAHRYEPDDEEDFDLTGGGPVDYVVPRRLLVQSSSGSATTPADASAPRAAAAFADDGSDDDDFYDFPAVSDAADGGGGDDVGVGRVGEVSIGTVRLKQLQATQGSRRVGALALGPLPCTHVRRSLCLCRAASAVHVFCVRWRGRGGGAGGLWRCWRRWGEGGVVHPHRVLGILLT